MGRSKKILEEIHPLHIIREVQKWPVLYAKDNLDRANLHFRHKVWREVGKGLFSEWDNFSESEKAAKVTDLMKKWRNLRDTFKKQLDIEQRLSRNGYEVKKKRYVYFKHMLFMLPHVSVNDDDTDDPVVTSKLDAYCKRNRQKAKKEVKNPTKSTPTNTAEDIDEDKHFLMSLVPSFKRMTVDEKLTAKMGILKLISEVRSNSVTVSVANSSLVDSLEPEVSEVKMELFQDVEEVMQTGSQSSDDSDY